MANNVPQIKTDIKAALQNNLDAATRTKLMNRFVAAYPGDFQRFLTAGSLADNAANRATYVAERIYDWIDSVYQAEDAKEKQAAIPAAEKIV